MKRRKPNRDHAPPLIIDKIVKVMPGLEPKRISLPRVKWLEKDAPK
jgi:hypothetical protein